MRINTNIAALTAYNALNYTGSQIQKTMQKLATGLRINSASDDAAGLAISEKMRAQTRGLDMALRNTQDGVSLLQTAEGALSSTQSILQRMRELSVQAANDTLTANDRSYIQLEIEELKDEINRIANTTQFNGRKLLDGSSGALWGTNDLGTKALVRGGLTARDQFNQKVVAEGNYNIEISADPGAAQVQKSGIMITQRRGEEFTREETVRNLGMKTMTKTIVKMKTETTYDGPPEPYYIYLEGPEETGGKAVGSSIKTGDPATESPDVGALKDQWDFVEATKTLLIKESGTYYIKGTKGADFTQNNIKVADGITVTIKLENVNIDVSGTDGACAFEIGKNATVNLFLSGENTLKSGSGRAGIEVPGWPSGSEATLVINSGSNTSTYSLDGKLTVVGGQDGAGIGGPGSGDNGRSGNITINGGTLDVTGGKNGAGIGGGHTQGHNGGGHTQGHNGGGTITINGGDITAISPLDGGIGTPLGSGTDKANNGGTVIKILGGKVKANGGDYGAGIGGGMNFDGGTILIKDGISVTEIHTPMKEPAFRSACQQITETGSYVYAVAGTTNAAAIGHGDEGQDTPGGIDLHANLPDPVYPGVPTNWPTVRPPKTDQIPYNEYVTEETMGLTEYKRTVTDENHAKNKLSEIMLNGAMKVEADNLPEGHYTVKTMDTPVATATATLTGEYGFDSSVADLLTVNVGAAAGLASLNINANILFEVTGVDKTNKTVTLKATANLLSEDGTVKSHIVREGMVLSEGTAFKLTGLDLSGEISWETEETAPNATMTLGTGQTDNFSVGNKFVYNFTAAPVNAQTVEVSGTQSGTSLTAQPVRYGLVADALAETTVNFSNFYLDSTGTVYDGEIALTLDENPLTGGTTLATFKAERVDPEDGISWGPAKAETKLADIRTFYNASGVFMLDSPQTITITQGDGRSASVTLYANDTIEDIRGKLNRAIADDLGQARHVTGDVNRFVTFVEEGKAQANGLETVEGTFIIRSAVAGRAGELSFSGDQDLLNALALNTIQESSESRYTASVTNAHTGQSVATNVRVTGNSLNGILHENIDVEFDAMSGVNAEWNEAMRRYELTGGKSRLTVHLADNGVAFQVGANRGEELFIDIGAMSTDALGITNVNVTTRERAARSIGTLDRAITRVSAQRAKIGAYQNSLEYTIENLTTTATNLTAAESRIRDADMAQTMMELVKLQILNQSGTSMLAQANQLPQQVLSLLQ